MTFAITDLNETELNTIVNGLVQMPYGQVFQLIEKIKSQVSKQSSENKVSADD